MIKKHDRDHDGDDDDDDEDHDDGDDDDDDEVSPAGAGGAHRFSTTSPLGPDNQKYSDHFRSLSSPSQQVPSEAAYLSPAET